MPFEPSPAHWPPRRAEPEDPRFIELFTPDATRADLLMAGTRFDGAVLGRKGARDGPTAIREAMRFLASHDPDTNTDLTPLRIHDAGDVAGITQDDVLAAHAAVRGAMVKLFGRAGLRPAVLLGGDHSLTFPHVQAMADALGEPGHLGIVVIDAHYDLRGYQGQPSSGTPFRRLLEELKGLKLRGSNLVEVGIRPYANTTALARYAETQGVHVRTAASARAAGPEAVVEDALERAGDGVDHLWISLDIDGLDQSIASGCSSPGAGGLDFHTASALVAGVARDPRCRAMDVLEVAPNLDPSGNTARTAAQLVAAFAGAAAGRRSS